MWGLVGLRAPADTAPYGRFNMPYALNVHLKSILHIDKIFLAPVKQENVCRRGDPSIQVPTDS